jgi:RHS repeat-associated protein
VRQITSSANGNEKTKSNSTDSWTYSYDDRNELTSVTHTASGIAMTATYTYDAFGNRIKSDVTLNSVETVTQYALDMWNPAKAGQLGNSGTDVLADLNGSGSLKTRYLDGDAVDQAFAQLAYSGGTFTPNWYLTDMRGSVRDIIDNSGTVKDSITYNGFGKITSETNSANRGRYAWTGRELDVETGLQYNRARYYDPVTGRWTGQDPLGFDAGDSNLYRYVHNDPTNLTDPSGFDEVVEHSVDFSDLKFHLRGNKGETRVVASGMVKGTLELRRGQEERFDGTKTTDGIYFRFTGDNAKNVHFIQLFYITVKGVRYQESFDKKKRCWQTTEAQSLNNWLPQFRHKMDDFYSPVVSTSTAERRITYPDVPKGAKDPYYDAVYPDGRRTKAGYDQNKVAWMWDRPTLVRHMAEEQGIDYLKNSPWTKGFSAEITFTAWFTTYAVVNGKSVGKIEWNASATANKFVDRINSTPNNLVFDYSVSELSISTPSFPQDQSVAKRHVDMLSNYFNYQLRGPD